MTYLVEVLPEFIEDSHISYDRIITLLEEDAVDLSKIQSIRLFNK